MAPTKNEIEEAIRGKDDFIKINYLQRFLREADNLETKKFILLHLAGISESRGMWGEAIRNIAAAGDISVTFREKIEFYMKEAELHIKLGKFDLAERAFQKSHSYGNSQEKMQMKAQYIELYRMQARIAEESEKHRKAIEIYEKLFSVTVNEAKRVETREKLADLYERVGRMGDARRMRG